MASNEKELKREIGVNGLSANLVNTMIGAGIFVLPATVAAGLGSSGVIAYLFCGVLNALVMLCFAEVGSKVTDSGGAYAYIKHAFGRYLGFITSILFILSAISANAAVANAIADVIASFYSPFEHKVIRILFFFILFSGLAYVNVIGVKKSIGFIKFITLAKILPLLAIVVVGWTYVNYENLSIESFPSMLNLGEISLVLFFAFQGSESGLSVSGEVKNPQRTIPRAIFISIFGVLILYVLIQSVAQGVLGSALPGFEKNPLSEVAAVVFGPIGFTLITIGAAVSMFGNLSSEVLSIPRVLFGAAHDQVIPSRWLARIHPKYATPVIAITVYAFLAFLFASWGGFIQLAIISNAAILLIYLGVALAVVRLRKTEKAAKPKKSFKIPGGYLVPFLAVFVILWFLSHLSPNEMTGMAVYVLVLSILYFLINRIRSR